MKAILALLVLALVAVALAQERYPAGVSAATCPNYPFCAMGAGSAPPGYIFDQRQGYPAGVHPAVCPNYPYC